MNVSNQLAAANSRIEVLTQNYAELEKKTEDKYKTQLDMLESERTAWSEKVAESERLHKYFSRIKLTGAVIGAVVALGIGIIIGCLVMSKTGDSGSNSAPIIHYINESDRETDSATVTDDNTMIAEDENN